MKSRTPKKVDAIPSSEGIEKSKNSNSAAANKMVRSAVNDHKFNKSPSGTAIQIGNEEHKEAPLGTATQRGNEERKEAPLGTATQRGSEEHKEAPPGTAIQRGSEEHKAGTKILKFLKSHKLSKKYKFSVTNQMGDYDSLLIGNDPIIDGLEQFKSRPEDRIALIGTSGLRSVLLACELSGHTKEQENLKSYPSPKIFIIDNSNNVHRDWLRIQKIAASSNDEKEFLEKIFSPRREGGLEAPDGSFEMETYHRHPFIYYHNPNDVKAFLIDLFGKFGYEFVRRAIMDATLIKQTWQDEETFAKIKNRLDLMNIAAVYAYPSNIGFAPFTGSPQELMRSIAQLKAKLSIHTNYYQESGLPERFYLVVNPKSIEDVKYLLKKMSIEDVIAHDKDEKNNEDKILSPHQKIKK